MSHHLLLIDGRCLRSHLQPGIRHTVTVHRRVMRQPRASARRMAGSSAAAVNTGGGEMAREHALIFSATLTAHGAEHDGYRVKRRATFGALVHDSFFPL